MDQQERDLLFLKKAARADDVPSPEEQAFQDGWDACANAEIAESRRAWRRTPRRSRARDRGRSRDELIRLEQRRARDSALAKSAWARR